MVAQQNTKHLVRIALCMRQEIEDDLFICSGEIGMVRGNGIS